MCRGHLANLLSGKLFVGSLGKIQGNHHLRLCRVPLSVVSVFYKAAFSHGLHGCVKPYWSPNMMCLCWTSPPLTCSSSRLSNGETESVKTMIVHEEGESDAGTTPCKDSTLIVRQVLGDRKKNNQSFTSYFLAFPLFVHFVCSYPDSLSILFVCFVGHVLTFWPVDSNSVLRNEA